MTLVTMSDLQKTNRIAIIIIIIIMPAIRPYGLLRFHSNSSHRIVCILQIVKHLQENLLSNPQPHLLVVQTILTNEAPDTEPVERHSKRSILTTVSRLATN